MNSLYLTHNGITWIQKIRYFADWKLECGMCTTKKLIFKNVLPKPVKKCVCHISWNLQLHNEKVIKQGKNKEKVLFHQLASIAMITVKSQKQLDVVKKMSIF